jgi:hypothetical protein
VLCASAGPVSRANTVVDITRYFVIVSLSIVLKLGRGLSPTFLFGSGFPDHDKLILDILQPFQPGIVLSQRPVMRVGALRIVVPTMRLSAS